MAIRRWLFRIIAIFILAALFPQPAQADCAAPTGVTADTIYNTNTLQFQYCDGTNWIAMHQPPPPLGPTGCSNIGDVCSDGSVYAGLSPDGNVKMYTTAADEGGFPWNNGNGSGYTSTSQTSTTTGESNTTNLLSIDSDSGVAGTQPHLAAQVCADSTANGYIDWYLPAKGELNVLYTNKAAIGGFNVSGGFPAGFYWSSSDAFSSGAWQQGFIDGSQMVDFKYEGLSVRCVRKVSSTCTSPAMPEGSLIYNPDYRVLQGCAGGVWKAMGPIGGTGASGCDDIGAWTAQAAAEANSWGAVTYGNGLFVAVASDGTNQVMTSPDGINWTAHAAAEANFWGAVTYGNGSFVAVAYSGTNRVMTSPDGITWTPRTVAEANNWVSVTYANGLFVAVATNGTNQVMTSPDGITWTPRTATEANNWRSVTYGNGLFIAVSANGTNRVMTSPDGITWTPRAAAEANNWQSVTYGNGLFVAVAGSGTNRVMTSPDGITWTPRAAAAANLWRSVTYGNGLFVAVADSGTNRVMTSPDGINWAGQAAAEANGWYSATYANGLFVAVAYSGTNRVMTAECASACTNPDHPEGTLMYNSSGNLMQYCDGANWIAIGKSGLPPPDACAGSPSPGDVCADGTVYAGLSPDGNVKMYATRCDAGQSWVGSACTGSRFLLSWNNGTTNWTTTGYTSDIAGETNTTGIAGLSDAGSPHDAAQYCDGLSQDGYMDWYLPAREELNVMYGNAAVIGHFDASGNWYWSSTENSNFNARNQRFSDGSKNSSTKDNGWLVRCVRR